MENEGCVRQQGLIFNWETKCKEATIQNRKCSCQYVSVKFFLICRERSRRQSCSLCHVSTLNDMVFLHLETLLISINGEILSLIRLR